ncbi:hypothetical protein C4Q28_14440 [Pseudomonas sp. SWI6]|uniref:4-oxalocrotonate tautomerase n=1 Tax=Pseudomonas taiwanensis TaxID=470150 RepID=A0ABR6V9U6_9PSED|nr:MULTISPECIES: hypothetical protein [Pseudomonas]AGZ35251.1 hypothetical protein PVLB_12315 [Pseudomonas sp. VLB120]AVD83280.1 hypothetical protein C4Q28_14440 [Pseudomonas sp. SWI6]AVD90474.1 hypothetical protein C4Q26_26465 [Pseudomonas sp. SWI44]MBC3477298.1 hypothetical protein [Pseudomonas taiwanensis]MBC3491655.1 hypothetical protein [Pseudomonas taiwanensis]
MPTITVSSAALQPVERKRVALACTRQLKQLGADPAHCLVLFETLPPGHAFSAGMPLPSADQHGAPLQFHLRITLSVERDLQQQQRLAQGLHSCLRSVYPSAFIYIHINLIEPAQVYYSAGPELINADHRQGSTVS